ncbi:hypothetical protein AB0A66_19720 [Streptomyces longwoodensis]|uniref:hypothetical protein n=1 Tax=Streptomyces longwoodensis TaxID=68231 RepID=UPI0033E351FF
MPEIFPSGETTAATCTSPCVSTPRTTSRRTGGSVLEEVLRSLVVMVVAFPRVTCWVDGTDPLGQSEP